MFPDVEERHYGWPAALAMRSMPIACARLALPNEDRLSFQEVGLLPG